MNIFIEIIKLNMYMSLPIILFILFILNFISDF